MKLLQSGQHFGKATAKVSLNGITLTEAGYFPDIEVPWHYHENAYFFMHLRGRLDECNKKGKTICTPGTLLFHNWQDPHYDTNFSRDARFYHIEVERKWFQRFDINPTSSEGSTRIDHPALKEIFKKIHNEIKLNDKVTQLSVDGLLAQAFAILHRDARNASSKIPDWVKKVQEILLEQNVEKITLQFLASESGIHPVHLSKEFSKYFRTGFGDFMRKRRLDSATTLLTLGDLSIAEIAHECGYSDESHFIRCFKQMNGMTPLKYRKLHFGRS
jgi:AraC family transcriptional regulator